MGWQKCPICDGTGIYPGFQGNTSTICVCPTCKGGRIINELNGLPLPCYQSNQSETQKSTQNGSNIQSGKSQV